MRLPDSLSSLPVRDVPDPGWTGEVGEERMPRGSE